MIGTRRRRTDDLSAAAACYDLHAAALYHFLLACDDQRQATQHMAAVFAAHFRSDDPASCPSRAELLRTAHLVTDDVRARRAGDQQASLVARAESLALVARLDLDEIGFVLDVDQRDVCRLLDHTLRRLSVSPTGS